MAITWTRSSDMAAISKGHAVGKSLSIEFPLRLIVNVALALRAERAVRCANRLAYQRGFRAIRFGRTGEAPAPHVTLCRVWVDDSDQLSMARELWDQLAREIVAEARSEAISLLLGAPELRLERGPYLIADVTPANEQVGQILHDMSGTTIGGTPVRKLHITVGASRRKVELSAPTPMFAALRTHARSIRLSVQGPYGVCMDTLEEVPLGPQSLALGSPSPRFSQVGLPAIGGDGRLQESRAIATSPRRPKPGLPRE